MKLPVVTEVDSILSSFNTGCWYIAKHAWESENLCTKYAAYEEEMKIR